MIPFVRSPARRRSLRERSDLRVVNTFVRTRPRSPGGLLARSRRRRVVERSRTPQALMQIQLVFFGDGLRATDATVLERAVQLGPQSQTRAQVNVRMQQVSLQEVSVRTWHA